MACSGADMGLIGHFFIFLGDLGPVSIGHYPRGPPRVTKWLPG
jgi:hypothetical protein